MASAKSRRHDEIPLFKSGDMVTLNNAGRSCWERNKVDKFIPPESKMKVIGTPSFDNGHWIIKVEYNNKVDYYFEYCLRLA